MKTQNRMGRVFLASALAVAFACAHAAGGVTVMPSQESLVTMGMTMDEVRQALGRPAQSVQYRNGSGPTWTYHVIGSSTEYGGDSAVFDVDFGANGTVMSANQRVLPTHSSSHY